MSDFEAEDLPPDLSDLAHRLRRNRYDAGPLELDAIKTDILKRGTGPRVARGRRMRKRTFVTALIMFGAIGTGSAGAVGFGGHFFSFANFFRPAPVHTAIALPAVTASTSTPQIIPEGTDRPGDEPPSASCEQYGCATSTTVRCSPLLTFFDFTVPSVCRVTVTNLTNRSTPRGTVVVTASGGPTKTCTLRRSFGRVATCTVIFGRFNPGNLSDGFIKFGSSTVTAHYLGRGGLAPSSGSTTMFVTVVVASKPRK